MIILMLIQLLLAFLCNKALGNNIYTDNIGITVTWSDNTDSTDFVMSINSLNSGKYFAFGLSNDRNMVIKLDLINND